MFIFVYFASCFFTILRRYIYKTKVSRNSTTQKRILDGERCKSCVRCLQILIVSLWATALVYMTAWISISC